LKNTIWHVAAAPLLLVALAPATGAAADCVVAASNGKPVMQVSTAGGRAVTANAAQPVPPHVQWLNQDKPYVNQQRIMRAMADAEARGKENQAKADEPCK